MSAVQSNDFKETVRAQTDIVSLIGETVRLQAARGGREFVGLCPFHDDHNPSMRVYPGQQTFRCWVCNTGGDCFTFVMESEKVDFRQALEILAQRAGVPVPKRSGRGAAPPAQDKAGLLEALLWAQGQFEEALKREEWGEPARQYLAGRGFTPETITHFRLGFHPNDWTWLLDRARGRFTPQQLRAVGLVMDRDDGQGYLDYFKNRVMFPIHNERGQPVGFGGRVLPGDDAGRGKYFNSPENPVFHKSRLVYALNHAREAIKTSETAVVMEGYTDCIAAHQAGIHNVVATLGTALTEMQVTTIKRFARRVVLVYDGDQAGLDASERAVSRFLAQDVDLRILTLPDGQDPADFLTSHGAGALEELIDQAPEAFDFVFNAYRRKYGIDTIDSRQRIMTEVTALLAAAPHLARNVREKLLLRRTAERLGIAEDVVHQQYVQARRGTAARPPAGNSNRQRIDRAEIPEQCVRILKGQPTRDDRLESELLQCLVAAPVWTRLVRAEVGVDDFTNPVLRSVAQACFDLDESGLETPAFPQLLSALDGDEPAKRLVVWLDEQAAKKYMTESLRPPAGEQRQTTMDDCPILLRRSVEELKWRREEQSHKRMVLQLSEQCEGARSVNSETSDELLARATRFHQKRATKKASG